MAVQVASFRVGEPLLSLTRQSSYEWDPIRPSQTEIINAGCVVAKIGHPIESTPTRSRPAALTLTMFNKPTLTFSNSSNRPRLERRDANRPSPKSRSPRSKSPRFTAVSIQSDYPSTEDSTTCSSPCSAELAVVDPRETLEHVMRHNFKILTSFKKHPFLIHGDTVLKGFIRRNECLIEGGGHLVPGIIKLCASYYVDSDAGIFQIAFKLHRVLKKAKRRSVTMRMARTLMDKYLEQKGSRTSSKVKVVSKTDIEFYCTELVRLGYLVPISPRPSCKTTSTGKLITSRSKSEYGREMLYQIPMEKVLEFSCFQH